LSVTALFMFFCTRKNRYLVAKREAS